MKAIFAFVLCALSAALVTAKVCPGGGQSCQAYMTCCELPSGQQGCCPHPNATCCPDKVHCCPSGYYCRRDGCQKREKVTGLTKLMIDYQEPNVEVVEGEVFTNASIEATFCPDGSQCEDGQTCCKISPNEYGCCPLDHAVCCSDMKHCCPRGMRCDGRGDCTRVQDEESENEVLTSATIKATAVNTICPGGTQTCPAGDTCCPHSYGQYGCCPLLAATCCDDRMHCCPHGYRCDGRGYCTRID